MNPPPRTVVQDCRAVATRLERLATEYLASKDQALLEEAARILHRIADEFDSRPQHLVSR